MKGFLRKKRYAFIFFFVLSYLIGLISLYSWGMVQEAKYEKEKAQMKKEMEEELKIESKTLYSENGVTIKQLSLSPGEDGGFNINLEVINDTDKRFFIFADEMRINGIAVDGSGIFDESVEPKSSAIIKFETNNYSIKDLGYDKVLSVKSDLIFSEVFINESDTTNSFLARNVIDVALPGAENLSPPSKEPEGTVVFDDNGIRVKLLKKDGKVFDSNNWFYIYAENTRDEDVALVISSLDGDNTSINQGELKDVHISDIVFIDGNSAYYGGIAVFSLLDLQEKLQSGEYLKVLMGTLSVETKDPISEQIHEILLK